VRGPLRLRRDAQLMWAVVVTATVLAACAAGCGDDATVEPGDTSARGSSDLRFARPPIVVFDTYSDNRTEFQLFSVAVRTNRPLRLDRRRYLQGDISVEGVFSADPAGRVGKRGRHCYASNTITPPRGFGTVEAGRIVTVRLHVRGGPTLSARVPLRDQGSVRSPFWRELGCGGRKT
jgi:predicted small secreted protein